MFRSLKSRMLLVMLGIIAITSVTFMYFSQQEIETAMLRSEESSARNILRLTILAIENQYESLSFFKKTSLEAHKRELKNIVSVHEGYVRNIYNQFKQGLLSEEAAKQRVLDESRVFQYGDKDYIWISNYDSVLISHPDPKLYGADFSHIKDVNGDLIVPPMVELGRKNGKGYHSYWWRRLGRKDPVEKLSYFVHFPEWKWVMGTGVYIDDIEAEAKRRIQAMLKELRHTFSKIKIAQTGYLYLFNANKEILIHPSIKPGTNISGLKNPTTGRDIFDDLIKASENPDKPLEYLWDKPDRKNEYKFLKESYVYYFEPMKWYIVSSVYKDEMYQPAKNLRQKIFYLSGIFFIVVIILSLLFSNTLSIPLRNLVGVMKTVKEKGLLVENVPISGGVLETKELAEIFNEMLKHLRKADQVNADLYKNLEEYNRTLEQRVMERTEELNLKNVKLEIEIEERKRIEEELNRAKNYLENVFENSADVIVMVDRKGNIIQWNKAATDVFGYSFEELRGKSSNELYPDKNGFGKMLEQLRASGFVRGYEIEMRKKEGEIFPVEISISLLKDQNKNVLGSVAVVRDLSELKKALTQAEAANKKIMESLHYAKMIQSSLMANLDHVKSYLPYSFFIWEPRDIVGGDIFYTDVFEDGFIVVVIDCTGHGIPGAFMTMIASTALKRITKDEGCHDPAEILKRLNYIVKTTLQQDTEYATSDDGLDAGVCFVSKNSGVRSQEIEIRSQKSEDGIQNSEFRSQQPTATSQYQTLNTFLTFAGARLPLYYSWDNEITVVRGDRQSIGYKRSDTNSDFTNHTIRIEKGMSFYMATDGLWDQLDMNDRSFGKKRFRDLLQETAHIPFERQRQILLKAYEIHKTGTERQDDMTVIGFGF